MWCALHQIFIFHMILPFTLSDTRVGVTLNYFLLFECLFWKFIDKLLKWVVHVIFLSLFRVFLVAGHIPSLTFWSSSFMNSFPYKQGKIFLSVIISRVALIELFRRHARSLVSTHSMVLFLSLWHYWCYR